MSDGLQRHTAASIAAQLGGELRGCGDVRITGVAAIDEAATGDITFIADGTHAHRWAASRASAAVVSRGIAVAGHDESTRALIEVDDAQIGLMRLLDLFSPPPSLPDEGIHPTAYVHPQAKIGQNVRIGAHVSIERGAVIGDGVVLHAGVRVYEGAIIGEGSELHANSVIRERCIIGKRVLLHQGVSIGGDGFGYRPSPVRGQGLLKMPHIGNVIIEDDVEIGSNSCVDRGKFRATVIGAGTKIDNLVQIAHNCVIGRSCVIAGLNGLAGSVTVGDWVQIGAQSGIAEGLTIGTGAKIGARSGVMRDVPPGVTVIGVIPAEEGRQVLRQAVSLRKLPELIRRFEKGQG
ncbi:MAG TPA: UDP-3-O-(3-hydroxymyristoyl)glucosamine N-acyltransferase [Phycisphaerales bacterium]|nr:UDP-3-O-(3-hydroxymyristoyl)glucosamine N-acyltransferase [Phycisphaerales bacterium]HRQ75357.1 UDP-3-O-(3-hydroxymyristoyl)glucosamine N-acyltransferase [Phycisphaerales bacterium]